MMEDWMIVILILLTVLAIGASYMMHRNDQVYELRSKIISLEYEIRLAQINDGIAPSEFRIYDRLPKYTTMVFRFWEPIKMETYLNDEEIEFLTNGWPQ